MLGIQNVPAFLAATTLVIVAPGPASLYVAGRAHISVAAAMMAVFGIVAGDIVLISLSGLGFSAVVSQWPMALTAIKIAGGLYVAYLGLAMLRAKPTEVGAAPPTAQRGALKGFLITLGNPKPLVFFSAFFPMFIDPATQHWIVSFYGLGALFQVINLLFFAAVILLVRLLRGRVRNEFPAARIQAFCGIGLLLCSGVVLASIFA